MKIPDSIQRSHILRALRTIRREGKVPPRRKAKKYYLLFESRKYPAKYALSLAYTFVNRKGIELRGFGGGKQTNEFLQSREFTIIDSQGNKVSGISPKGRTRTKPSHESPKKSDNRKRTKRRAFWIVSPNVRNNDQTISEWRQASITYRAAFMGYHPSDRGHKQIGYKFAHAINPGDVILIARRHRGNIEAVVFGVVRGKFRSRIKGLAAPQRFGSLRKLSPFVALSREPTGISLVPVLGHTTALRQLHPDRTETHKLVCEWLNQKLKQKFALKRRQVPVLRQLEVRLANLIQNGQLEYQVRKRKTVAQAKKKEAILLDAYTKWLRSKNRSLHTVKYKTLRCDAYEKELNNLIEAKSSTRREHIRMAVGELLDYAYLGRRHVRDPNLAILLPARPDRDVEVWLSKLHISVIWRKGSSFLDNANGQFS